MLLTFRNHIYQVEIINFIINSKDVIGNIYCWNIYAPVERENLWMVTVVCKVFSIGVDEQGSLSYWCIKFHFYPKNNFLHHNVIGEVERIIMPVLESRMLSRKAGNFLVVMVCWLQAYTVSCLWPHIMANAYVRSTLECLNYPRKGSVTVEVTCESDSLQSIQSKSESWS